MRLFAQLSWYFRREWRRYLGAIALLVIIAVLQLNPPKVVGIVVDGVTQQHYTAEKVWMWIQGRVDFGNKYTSGAFFGSPFRLLHDLLDNDRHFLLRILHRHDGPERLDISRGKKEFTG